jgi:hypothetical protein
MKNLKYIVGLLILAAVSCTTSLTDEQKNSDSVLLKQTHEYTLNSDGSMDYRYYHKRLFNSYQAINRYYGETFVIYNPDYQTLAVKKSETTMADGKKVQSPDNAFNPVLPSQAADAPAYNQLREMVITHVGLEIGAVVELDYTLNTKAGFTSFFGGRLMLNESSPIKNLEVIVKVPKGQELKHFVVNPNANLKLKKGVNGDFETYTWTAENVSARSNEPNQVEGMVDYQTLVFSNKCLKGTRNVLKSELTKEFAPCPTMDILLKSKAKDWDLVEEVRGYVANKINTYRLPQQFVGFKFRTPNEVWKSNGGTEGEKAILLASLLKHLGFNSEIALGAYPQYLNLQVGCPVSFDKYLVRVDINGEVKNLKAIPDYSEIPGQRVIIGLSDDLAAVNLEPKAKQNLKVELATNLQIDKDGAVTGKGKVQFSEYSKDKGLLYGIPSSSITSKELEKHDGQTVMEIELGKGVNCDKAGDYLSFSLPVVAQGLTMAHLGELPLDRVTRLELPGIIDETYEFTVKLPAGYTIAMPLYNEVVENAFGKVAIKYEFQNGEVKVTRNLNLTQGIVPVDMYSNFRVLYSLWMDKNMNRIIVTKE